MLLENELATITVLVNYSGNGDLVSQIVPFKVYQDDTAFLAVPLIGSEQCKKVHLPNEISFTVIAQQLMGTQRTEHLNEVTMDIVQELLLQHVLE
jgi:hypothetical protein